MIISTQRRSQIENGSGVVLAGSIFYHKEVIVLGRPNYDPKDDGYDDEQADEIRAWEESGERFREDMHDDEDED